MIQRIFISFEKGRYRAHFEGLDKAKGFGSSPDEAIGDLICHYGEYFANLKVVM